MDIATDLMDVSYQAPTAGCTVAPPMSRVEHAMAILRTHLIECAAQDDWGEHRAAQLMELFRTCVGHAVDSSAVARSPIEPPLPRPVLRQAFRFVNDHLDTKLKWEDIATEV